MNEIFNTMIKEEVIDYCYNLEAEGKMPLLHREFGCLIALLENNTISPQDLPDYGVNYIEL